MATSYFVKVYYTKQSQQQPEIRRFAIDIAPENDSYRELCNKVATYQPDIQVHGFLLQYVDEENERITFSSNDELRTAIGMNKDATPLKIFIVANSPKNATANDHQGTECHTGVTCDGCQGPVVGARYKCLVCDNYDLCEQCSAAGTHSEHNLMKISKPGNDAFHPYGFGRHARRHHRQRHGHPFVPPTFRPSAEMIERIQSQIPQWLPNREHVQTQIGNLKSTAETHVQNSKQYLETVGQYLQQTLSPFGINCDYRVEGEAAPAASAASSSTSSSSSSETESMNPEPSAVPKSPRPAESHSGMNSWLNMTPLSNNETVPTAPPAAASATPATSIRTPMEKSVDDCIELMKAMGFDENDHHLIDLIRSKNGDVNQVLDAINGKQNGQ